MVKVIEGKLDAKGMRVALVAGRFNEFIVQKLVGGALDALTRHNADENDLAVVWVPGSLEIPAAARKLTESGRWDAVVCLGAVIRGGTDHYTHVAQQAARGVAQLALESAVPVIFGILTTDSIEQAIERAGTKMGNKGAEAAMAAVEMVALGRAIDAAD